MERPNEPTWLLEWGDDDIGACCEECDGECQELSGLRVKSGIKAGQSTVSVLD